LEPLRARPGLAGLRPHTLECVGFCPKLSAGSVPKRPPSPPPFLSRTRSLSVSRSLCLLHSISLSPTLPPSPHTPQLSLSHSLSPTLPPAPAPFRPRCPPPTPPPQLLLSAGLIGGAGLAKRPDARRPSTSLSLHLALARSLSLTLSLALSSPVSLSLSAGLIRGLAKRPDARGPVAARGRQRLPVRRERHGAGREG